MDTVGNEGAIFLKCLFSYFLALTAPGSFDYMTGYIFDLILCIILKLCT